MRKKTKRQFVVAVRGPKGERWASMRLATRRNAIDEVIDDFAVMLNVNAAEIEVVGVGSPKTEIGLDNIHIVQDIALELFRRAA